MYDHCSPKIILGEAIEYSIGVKEVPTITATYVVKAGRVARVTIKTETAEKIKNF